MRDFTHLSSMKTELRNPFLDDVFIAEASPLPGVARIHHSPFERIVTSVESLVASGGESAPADSLGRLILITAPRAGYGKTHFVARLEKRVTPFATTVRLPFDPARPITWPVTLNALIRQLGQHSPGREGTHSLFEEAGRYLLARLVLSHREEESSLTRDCPAQEDALRTRYTSLFSRDDDTGTFEWIDEKGRELSYEASSTLQGSVGLRRSELGFWTRLIIDHQLRGETALDPLRGLSNGEARERLLQLLRIQAFHRPVLLLVDGLDGFFQSETAGLEIANLVTSVREAVPRSVMVICLNDDIWDSVFENRLPSAWIDRICSERETLRSIPPEAASELVRSRLESTAMTARGADRFVEQLESEHLWIDAETKLSPRSVIRQARELWEKKARDFLALSDEEKDESDSTSLAGLTDKAAFFEALRDDRPLPPPIPAKGVGKPVSTERTPENPFFAAPERTPTENLAGLESIIADIRGTGKRVVSESHPPASPIEGPGSIEAGSIRLRPSESASAPTAAAPSLLSIEEEPAPAAPASRLQIEQQLRDSQKEIAETAPLELDLDRIGNLIRTLGATHRGLSQTEERFPGSQTTCLRWNVHNVSVLIGFESPRNVYFWNNLLQQSLSSPQLEKISAFSHPSQGFDPGLFSSFGFSPTVIRGHIDIIEMNDRELSMLYAADEILCRYRERPEEETAREIITLFLDPLWRRISRPL